MSHLHEKEKFARITGRGVPFVFVILFGFVFLTFRVSGQDRPAPDFARDILPIFSDHCFACHGPDANTREAGFRLDLKESALGAADSGQNPIVPGDLEASELYRRITASDYDHMPPAESEKDLSDEQIQLIARWIEHGAVWESHWAFTAPRKPALPPVQNSKWPRNGIDHFVLKKLEESNRQPLSRADKATLIRRVTLDLIGLPPSLEEVDEFLNDTSPGAYEKVVDRLLASPHYGERIASDWLDAARFADTNGYQNDFARSMWPWRDWAIEAFNSNMPFDQFAVEQIAGDLLPEATLSQRIATGFNRNHRSNTEGGSIDQEWHVENVIDRVETTATVFLGLTMGCARCHDHKYDAISQREFYEFFAYFNSVNEKGVHLETRGNVPPLVTVVTDESRAKLDEFDSQLTQLRQQLEEASDALVAQQTEWEIQFADQPAAATPDDHKMGLFLPGSQGRPDDLAELLESKADKHHFVEGVFGPTLSIRKQNDSHLDLGPRFDFDGEKPFSCSVWVKPTRNGAILSRMDGANNYRGFDLLIMPDGRVNVHLIHKWPGNAIKITTAGKLRSNHWTHVAVTYDGSLKAAGLRVQFNSKVIEHTVDADTLSGSTLTDHPLWLGLRAQTQAFAGMISSVTLFDRQLSAGEVESIFNHDIRRLLKTHASQRDRETALALSQLYRERFAPQYAVLQSQMDATVQQKNEFEKALPTVMVLEELSQPRATYVLTRGQYDKPDMSRPVEPGVPSLLPQPADGSPNNRLGLANWIVDSRNPLTARVTVNRFWQHFFGVGLLETPENFGIQSPLPSHRQLLDWLATEFIDSGWDVKAMQKLIVTSATYCQSSNASAEGYQEDPDNRLLARGPRFRLPAEVIRDNALAISGLLYPQIGGPSIKPYQPAGVWEELAGGAGEGPYVQDTDENLYRRSLYIYRKRTVPHPTMATFDGAAREVCQVARGRTNTPLQALALLNDRTYVEAGLHLAAQMMDLTATDEEKLSYAFRRATSRSPGANELQVLAGGLARYRERFSHDVEAAKKYVSNVHTPLSAEYNLSELAAFASVASVILNLDETITKQ